MNIIEYIWSNTLELREGADLPPLASILDTLLAAPMICFASRTGGPAARSLVSYAGDEVFPNASLADILFEEFGIEISDQTIVLIEPFGVSDGESISSQDLGQALGQILVELGGLQHDEIPKAKQAPRSVFQRHASQPAGCQALVSLVQ